MEEARKEVDPSDFDEKDPLRPTEAKKADWKGIVKAATKALTESSKDLLVAARLTEALTKLYGYQGFREGLVLLLSALPDINVVASAADGEQALQQSRALSPWLAAPSGARLLEIGCGVGRWTRRMARTSRRVVGFDLSARMIHEARRRAVALGGGGRIATPRTTPTSCSTKSSVAISS